MNSKLSLLVSVLVLGASTTLSASDLTEALSSGKVSGDVSVTYENRSQDQEINAYYSDTGYSMGSVGINYETAKYNNLSAVIGFRAYKALWEDEKNDSDERFYQVGGKNKNVDLATAYFAYDLDNVHVKIGRQFISTEWINKTQDALRVDVNLAKTDIEFIWSQKQGRVYSRDFRPMTNINEDKGIYKLGVTQKITDSLSAKVYALTAPTVKDIYGAKVNFKADAFSLMAHYAATSEKVTGADNGSILEVKASTSYAGYSATLGYVQTDKDVGFGHVAGETIIPFEEGDQMYLADAKTTYLMVSKTFSGVSLTGLYGVTDYGNYDKSEFNIWAGYGITKDLSLAVGYALTDEDTSDAGTTDLSQLNATLTYKF